MLQMKSICKVSSIFLKYYEWKIIMYKALIIPWYKFMRI